MKTFKITSAILLFLLGINILLAQAGEAEYKAGMAAYENGDFTTALAGLKSAAESGNADAMHWTGAMYAKGEGVERDFSEAVKWYQKAADKNHSEGMLELGYMYANGLGINQNTSEAIKWYEKAADLNNQQAIVNLAADYLNVGNYPEAHKWIKKGIALNNGQCAAFMAMLYISGKEVPLSEAETVNWLKKAAEWGHPESMYNLASIYTHGAYGESANEAEVFKWMKKAAESGYLPAMYDLGTMYYYGDTIEQNMDLAKKWVLKAAELGDENAKTAKQQLGW